MNELSPVPDECPCTASTTQVFRVHNPAGTYLTWACGKHGTRFMWLETGIVMGTEEFTEYINAWTEQENDEHQVQSSPVAE